MAHNVNNDYAWEWNRASTQIAGYANRLRVATLEAILTLDPTGKSNVETPGTLRFDQVRLPGYPQMKQACEAIASLYRHFDGPESPIASGLERTKGHLLDMLNSIQPQQQPTALEAVQVLSAMTGVVDSIARMTQRDFKGGDYSQLHVLAWSSTVSATSSTLDFDAIGSHAEKGFRQLAVSTFIWAGQLPDEARSRAEQVRKAAANMEDNLVALQLTDEHAGRLLDNLDQVCKFALSVTNDLKLGRPPYQARHVAAVA